MRTSPPVMHFSHLRERAHRGSTCGLTKSILAGPCTWVPGKKWNLSTMMYYDFNRKKNNADINVGDILTLAGGVGRSLLKGANAGVAYGAQWKMTHDAGADIPAGLPLTNGRVFGVGPEIDMPVF